MKIIKINRIGAIFLTTILIAAFLSLPMTGAITNNRNSTILNREVLTFSEDNHPKEPIRLDKIYNSEEYTLNLQGQNDIGYNVDAGNEVRRSLPVYIGEPVDHSVPGRGRTGPPGRPW